MPFTILGVLLVIDIFAIAWSGKTEIVPAWPEATAEPPLAVAQALRRYIWFLALALGAGIASGIVMFGAAGRLAKRLLAVTAGDDAQGRVTEAGEIVGRIRIDGSLGFHALRGRLGWHGTWALYVLIHRWLPAGRRHGPAFGALLLVLGATRLDALRPDTPDFDIFGPGWLSVLVFTVWESATGCFSQLLLAAIVGPFCCHRHKLASWSATRQFSYSFLESHFWSRRWLVV